MKSKSGFTLVELLAVIVILAIIAVIATPIILGVIDEAKKGAAEQSAYGYIDAVEKQVVIDQVNDKNSSLIPMNGVVSIANLSSVNVKGQKPSDGIISLQKGVVIEYSLKIGDYVVNYNNNKTTTEKNGKLKDISEFYDTTIILPSFIVSDNTLYLSYADALEIVNDEYSYNISTESGNSLDYDYYESYIFDSNANQTLFNLNKDNFKKVLDSKPKEAWDTIGGIALMEQKVSSDRVTIKICKTNNSTGTFNCTSKNLY